MLAGEVPEVSEPARESAGWQGRWSAATEASGAPAGVAGVSLDELKVAGSEIEPRHGVEQAQELAVSALEAVLVAQAPVVKVWEDVARRLRLPRPPQHLPPPARRAYLAHLVGTFSPQCPGQFGVSDELALLLARLAEPQADLDAEVPRLAPECVSELLGGVIYAALLYAPVVPETGWRLGALSYRLVQELKSHGVRGRRLRGFEGEALAMEAVLQSLDGDLAAARHLLLRAEVCLRTRARLRAWRRHAGWLQPPASPHMPLRAHGLWLHCRGIVEAVAGHVSAAVACWQQTYQLYLLGGLYFGAGLAAMATAGAQQWLGEPARAVRPLETALQLLDRRALYKLGDHQEWSLACLYAQTGQVERCLAELQHLRARVAEDHPRTCRVSGLLDLARQAATRARECLAGARLRATERSLRLQLTLDLAELELSLHQSEPARRWLVEGRRDVEALTPGLQALWWQARESLDYLPQLRGELLRALACERVAWRPLVSGSLLDDEAGSGEA